MTQDQEMRAKSLWELCYRLCFGTKSGRRDVYELQMNAEHYELLAALTSLKFENISGEETFSRFFCGVPVRVIENCRLPRLMKEVKNGYE